MPHRGVLAGMTACPRRGASGNGGHILGGYCTTFILFAKVSLHNLYSTILSYRCIL